MKKFFLTLSVVLSILGAFAQLPANRTAATTVADALAQIPANDKTVYNALMRDLAQAGEESIPLLASKLNAPGVGSNALTEYALSGIAHYVSGAGDETLRAKTTEAFIKALKATDDPTNKQFIIGLLQITGKDEAVDALAPLLASPEPQVSDAACRAVAAINSPKTALALKTALMRKTGTVENQRNIVQAIGEAQVEGAEELILPLLATDDEALKRSALFALGRVGGAASLKALEQEAEKAGYGYEKTGATEAYLALLKRQAENPLAVKETEKSATALLQNATKQKQNATRIGALEILINIRKNNALKTVTTALKDTDRQYRNASLTAFSAYSSDKAYSTIATLIPKSSPETKADIINWIGREARKTDKKTVMPDLLVGKTTLLQTIINQLEAPEFDVKQAASSTLVVFRDTHATPALVKLLTDADPKVIALGKSSLAATKGDISAHIADRLHAMTDSGKIAGLDLIASRRAKDCFKNVLFLAQKGSPEVKAAAFRTLKSVSTTAQAETLATLALNTENQYIPDLQQAGIAAISTLPVDEQIDLLKKGMARSGNKRYLYFVPLAATGSPEALAFIQDGLISTDQTTRDAAFDALLTLNTKNAPDLLYDVCKNPDASQYFDRALDAYIKKVSNPEITGENRLIFLRKAMEIAQTDRQKNQILRRIQQTGTFLALIYAGEFLEIPALKENAAQAVMNIALNHKEYTGENVVNLLNKAAAALNNPDADYQRQAIKKHIDEMPVETGFVSLFNGRDLTGWKGLLDGGYDNPMKRATLKPAELKKLQIAADERMHRDWKVENGLLAFVGHGYDNLCTTKQYGDFEMYVDWLLDPAGPEADAGIYLRGTPQVQIWDTARTNVGAQVGSGGLYNNKTHASKPLTVADNRLGEWNTLYIKMTGDRVTVKLNGVLVVDNIVLENYWDRRQPVPAVEQIELQAHGSKVYYRNIYVKELPRPKPFELSAQEKKEGFTVLFDGTNMHEWRGNLVDYQLEDGCISVHPTGSFGGNLYTKKEYANFVFRFEFQLTPAANNGVGIRAPMEGDNAYNAMEIQILDCEHPVYADIKPWQHHGSVYGVIAAEHGAMRPAGEWNEEEITADGDHIRVTLNGHVILDGNIREASKNGTLDGQQHPGLLNQSGHIGFLGHGNELKFRNIRIKEL
jgi:HEAT repeat protein